MRSVQAELGIGSTETLRRRVCQAEVGGGARPGVAADEQARVREPEREERELRRANELAT